MSSNNIPTDFSSLGQNPEEVARLLTKPIKGRILFDECIKYLESQGLEHGDFSCYFFKDLSLGDTGGIQLSYTDEGVMISILSPHLATASKRIEFTGANAGIKGTLDLVIFALRMLADERQDWLDNEN